jgi:hypothetical protein
LVAYVGLANLERKKNYAVGFIPLEIHTRAYPLKTTTMAMSHRQKRLTAAAL